jgi:hypothetical protein
MSSIRKLIREYVIANGPATEAQLITAGDANGASERRCRKIIDKMIERGKIIKSGDDHTWA